MRRIPRRTSNSRLTRRFWRWREGAMNRSRSMRRMLRVSLSGDSKERKPFSSLDLNLIKTIFSQKC